MLHQPDLRITYYTCRLFTTFPLSPMLLSLKTWIKWPSVLTATAGLLSIIFHLLQYSKQQPSLSAHRATLMTKTDFTFPAFSLSFVDFTVQFCFHCKFSFHEKWFESSLTVAWFSWNNHNSLLCIATNEIASFCMDKRLCHMVFFVFVMWAEACFWVMLKDFEIKISCSYYFVSLKNKTNRSHVAMHLFSKR